MEKNIKSRRVFMRFKSFKTLYLTEYLLKNGPAKFIGDLRGQIFHIRMLKRFFYQENKKDKGQTSNKEEDFIN